MREPVTLHVLSFIQGHHTNHSTEFVLTSEGGSPDRPEDVISRIKYPQAGVPGLGLIQSVAAEMNTELLGPLTVLHLRPEDGWIDRASFNGYREVSDSDE